MSFVNENKPDVCLRSGPLHDVGFRPVRTVEIFSLHQFLMRCEIRSIAVFDDAYFIGYFVEGMHPVRNIEDRQVW